MRPDQLTRLEALRDKLVDVALRDADPANWVAGDKVAKDMTRDERGDAKWCRGLAINSVTLVMQVQRLMANPATDGAVVPTSDEQPQEDPIDAEVARFEHAAAEVLAARAVRSARDGKPRK